MSLKKGGLPRRNSDYGSVEYWDTRYEHEREYDYGHDHHDDLDHNHCHTCDHAPYHDVNSPLVRWSANEMYQRAPYEVE